MTPEEIKKEQEASKASPIEQAPAIQSNKADIEEASITSTELSKSRPVDTTPPKESDREYGNKVGDYNKVVEAAKRKGVDLNNIHQMPLMDSDKDKITEAVKGMYPKEFAQGINNLANSITAPQNEARNKLDAKALMNAEKQKRRAAWADALYAFGEGLQGKTANQDNFVSTKIQRKLDEDFQNYKDTTERNQKTKYLWENQTRKELVDWADEQAKNERLDANTRAKMKQLADQHRENMDFKNKDFTEKTRHDKAMENKKSGKMSKEDRPVVVQTAQKTYTLKPEEAAFYKGEILKNADTLRNKYPGWFTEGQKSDPLTGEPTGEKTFKLNPEVKDVDMIRAYLEEKEPGHLNEDAYEQNKASYFDKYRKQQGLSTTPASQDVKPSTTVQKPQAQPQKADPLGLR
ncbi:MAG: hypothetical protein PHT07_20900 [Paludibacter sp.]|nr:hypothetical protein [Paludibacter sp.]